MSRFRALAAAALAALTLAACVSTAAQPSRYDDYRPYHGNGGP